MFLFIILLDFRLLLYREPSQRPDLALLWKKAGPLSIFVSQEEPLFFSKGAIGTVNGRLKRKATTYPSRVREKKDVFCFVYSFLLTLVDREAGLFPHSLFYTPFIYYITPFFLLLYIYQNVHQKIGGVTINLILAPSL